MKIEHMPLRAARIRVAKIFLFNRIFRRSSTVDQLQKLARHQSLAIEADLDSLPAILISLAASQYSLDLNDESRKLFYDAKAISLVNNCFVEISNLQHKLHYLPKPSECESISSCEYLVAQQQEIQTCLWVTKAQLANLAGLIDTQRGQAIGFEHFLGLLGSLDWTDAQKGLLN